MCPSPSVIGHALPLRETNSPLYLQYLKTGLSAINSGKAAVLLLAGGQGTRLGCSYPKGMYDIGLPSKRSLFQLQAERLLAVCRRASGNFDKPAFIPWYIMTSDQTQQMTQAYFEEHNFFGYNREHIIFFEQFSIPVLDFNGKVLMHSRDSLCWSPEGNGGLYRALRERGILADMASRGVEYVHIYGVDNVLTKMADPHFLGFCISKEAECGAKVVEKTMPEESIGVVGVVDGKFRVSSTPSFFVCTFALGRTR
ncbi:unnamed protein product [Schistocephalus solidus]|uniref:UDP-N-acetylglucosamine diphosphorylase n=1 Tax=Schistocephalus solidus TaxID=70667 RepID=A0A183S8P5_SCHSO|nr:unnamed protein product [Schistocephalus solidus]